MPLTVVDRIRRVGMDEGAARQHLALRLPGRLLGHLVARDDVGQKDVRIHEDTERKAAGNAEKQRQEKSEEIAAHQSRNLTGSAAFSSFRIEASLEYSVPPARKHLPMPIMRARPERRGLRSRTTSMYA